MLIDDMQRLEEVTKQIKHERRLCNRKTKLLRDEKKLLEASIREEIIKTGQTMRIGNLIAEFVPTVVFSLEKEEKETEA